MSIRGIASTSLVVAALVGLALTTSTGQAQAAEAEAEPNRKSCPAIEGTPYRSAAEREWYWENCLGRPLPATVAQEFTEGYRGAGGPEHLLRHILYRVIPCESEYDPFAVNPAGPYYGLMQFWPATWVAAGGGNWFNPRQQGANTARLLRIADPATQWPFCWFSGKQPSAEAKTAGPPVLI